MSVFQNRMNKAESRAKAKALAAEGDLRDTEDLLLDRDLERVLARLAPLSKRADGDGPRALRSHLEATSREQGKRDAMISKLEADMDTLRKARSEKRRRIGGMQEKYGAQVRLKKQEIEWDEILETAGLSRRLPRTRGSKRTLVLATLGVAVLELGLLGPSMTSLVRDNAPTWSSVWVGVAAAAIVAVMVGVGASAVILTGRRYKEYAWAKSTAETAEEVNTERVGKGINPVPAGRPEPGGVVGLGLAAFFIQGALFIMRFIAEDPEGQSATLSVVVSAVATMLPVILFFLEKELHDPKTKGPRGYEQDFIEQFEVLKTELDEDIPRELARLKAERDLREESLLLNEVEAVRKHALSLEPDLVSTLDDMAREAKERHAQTRKKLEAVYDSGDLVDSEDELEDF